MNEKFFVILNIIFCLEKYVYKLRERERERDNVPSSLTVFTIEIASTARFAK